MKEKRGPLGRTVGAVAQGLADAARRRQAEREPRVVIYDGSGQSTLVRAGTPAHDGLVDAAERLVASVAGAPDEAAGDA
jgi:hypothetical protein